jgi:voltage-gated potassium channel
VVTLTTTGYGDMVPRTPLGQFITSLTILLGYGIIAFPTGIVGAELAASLMKRPLVSRTCVQCLSEGHDPDADFCKHCGATLPPYRSPADIARWAEGAEPPAARSESPSEPTSGRPPSSPPTDRS